MGLLKKVRTKLTISDIRRKLAENRKEYFELLAALESAQNECEHPADKRTVVTNGVRDVASCVLCGKILED